MRAIEQTGGAEQPRDGGAAGRASTGAASRGLAWAPFASTRVLAPVSIAFALATGRRDLLPDGSASHLLGASLAAAIALPNAVVGLLVARRQPRNAIGWIFLVSAAMLVSMAASYGYPDLAFLGRVGNGSFIPAVVAAPFLVPQLFPDGRPLPGPRRWVLLPTAVVGAQSSAAGTLDPGALDAYPSANPIQPRHVSLWLPGEAGR